MSTHADLKLPVNAPNPRWLDRDQPNALNLMRLIFAASVIFSHAWDLGGFGPEPLALILGPGFGGFSTHAVNAFFLISGFLITGSWLARKDAAFYLRGRVGRIWPGFAVSFFVSALIAAIAAGPNWWSYLRSIPIQSYVVGVVTLDWEVLERALSFPTVHYPKVVNGSMWTIVIEFKCYLAVALAGSIGLLQQRKAVLALALAALAILAFETKIHPDKVWQHWSRFGTFFGWGAVFWMYRSIIPKSPWLALACAAAALMSWSSTIATQMVMPTAGAYVMFFCAYSLPAWAKRIGAKNDLSYGVYLYAFPLQQLYYQYSLDGRLPHSPWANFAFVLGATTGFAWLSWLFVERPAMRMIRRIG